MNASNLILILFDILSSFFSAKKYLNKLYETKFIHIEYLIRKSWYNITQDFSYEVKTMYKTN